MRKSSCQVLACPPPFILNPIARSGPHFIKMNSRALHRVCSQLGLTTATEPTFKAQHAIHMHRNRIFKTNKLANQGLCLLGKSSLVGSVCVCTTPSYASGPSASSPTAGLSGSGSSPAAVSSGSSPAADPSDSSISNKRPPADTGKRA